MVAVCADRSSIGVKADVSQTWSHVPEAAATGMSVLACSPAEIRVREPTEDDQIGRSTVPRAPQVIALHPALELIALHEALRRIPVVSEDAGALSHSSVEPHLYSKIEVL